jgi:hypothetical protein
MVGTRGGRSPFIGVGVRAVEPEAIGADAAAAGWVAATVCTGPRGDPMLFPAEALWTRFMALNDGAMGSSAACQPEFVRAGVELEVGDLDSARGAASSSKKPVPDIRRRRAPRE